MCIKTTPVRELSTGTVKCYRNWDMFLNNNSVFDGDIITYRVIVR